MNETGQRPSLQVNPAKLLLAIGGLFAKNGLHDEARAFRPCRISRSLSPRVSAAPIVERQFARPARDRFAMAFAREPGPLHVLDRLRFHASDHPGISAGLQSGGTAQLRI